MGRFGRVLISNVIVIVSGFSTFALYVLGVLGIAVLIRDLPNSVTRPILFFLAIGGMALVLIFNYFLLKFVKKKFRVTDKDIIQIDA